MNHTQSTEAGTLPIVVTQTSTGELLAKRGSILPPFERIPKPRRRTELGLLVFVWVVISALYLLVALGAKNHLPAHAVAFLAVLAVISFSLNIINRWLAPHANALLVPLCVLLNGMGYVEIVRWNAHAAQAQAMWTALGVALYAATLLFVRRTRDLDRFRYVIFARRHHLDVGTALPGCGSQRERRETLGQLRWTAGVSASGDSKNSPRHLFRKLLRRQKRVALYPNCKNW